MLFDSWSLGFKPPATGSNPWLSHPFNRHNNVNDVDGDPLMTNSGFDIETMTVPATLRLQEAYVRKVIDTVGDLDNVLFEITNEADPPSTTWQYHMIDFIHDDEARRSKRHPVGMTATGRDSDLFNSRAEWVSPADGYKNNATDQQGSKVVLVDTDHIVGGGGDGLWVFKQFMRGNGVLYMDAMNGTGMVGGPSASAAEASARAAMGQAVRYGSRLNLDKAKPAGKLCSTGYCIADPGHGYAVLTTGGPLTLDLSAASGVLFSVEWYDIERMRVLVGAPIAAGSRRQFFAPPVSGPAVLLVARIEGHSGRRKRKPG